MNEKKAAKKRSKLLLSIFLTFFSILLLCYLCYAYIYRRHTEPETTSTSTTQESICNLDVQKLYLTLTPQVKRASFFNSESETEHGTYVIPGLLATETQTYGIKGESAICTSMTPQGLAVTPDYLLVSAYCHTQTHNSVIYVIDKETHQFIKEIVLKNKAHVGGLAYDPIHQNIWIAGMSSGLPTVNSISLEHLEEYCFQDTYKPISYSQTYDLHAIARSSFLAYHEESLYIGYFTERGSSVLEEYPIIQGGLLDTETSPLDSWDIAPLALPSNTLVIDEKAQGVTFYNDYMLFSHSYGPSSSYLRAFSTSHLRLLESENAAYSIRFPSRMEQICVDGDFLYVLFESAANAYQMCSLVQMDRILKLDLRVLLGE